jgi:peptide/nickel transport system permease protein
MVQYILRRLVSSIPVLFLVTLISFSLMQLVPGDPAILVAGLSATPEEVERVRQQLGLNQPFHIQLWHWYVNLLHGDLGTSFLLGRDVIEVTIERLPVSISIALYALVLTLVFGIVAGVLAALRQNSWLDQAVMTIALIGVSLPNFWLGLMLIVLFAVQLGWLPSGGYVDFRDDPLGWLRATTLPAISLAMLQMGLLARITRSTMLEVLRQDYIRTARSKGASENTVNYQHALRNAVLPVTTIIGIEAAFLIGGLIITETVFNIPGVAHFLVEAILKRDYPIVQNLVMFIAVVVVVINFIVDMMYAVLDPRIRYAD